MCTLFYRALFARPAPFYWAVTLLVALAGCQVATAQTLPTGFKLSKTQNNYTAPMGVVFSADGKRQFVWEKSGIVWVSNWDGAQYVKQSTPVLDISEEVGNYHDFGLASLCLDPNFSQNGLVYLYYQVDRHYLMKFGTAEYSATTNEYSNASISRVTRYQFAMTNGIMAAVANSRKMLLGETKSTGVPLVHESHAGGALIFGRDGSLLLSTGDNGSWDGVDQGNAKDTYHQQAINDGIMRANENVGSFRSQMLNSHCGKLLRMDPSTGDGLPSNPYYDSANPRSAQSRVWALGLRHPYRMSLLPNTGSTNMSDGNPGSVLIGDVGWNAWEETNIITQGGVNAGWPVFEGQELQPGGYSSAANTLENRDEPNPANTCNKPYLTFADLIKQPTNPVQTVNNPCSGQPLPGLQRRYIHARPAIDWKHGENVARTPTFNGAFPTATKVGDAGGAKGSPFGGSCAIGGAYYTGTAFPADWQNTYFFGDFSANWIKAATLDGNGNVTQVREFLPGGGASGIVDVEYNPLDGALYFVSIYSNEVIKISYGGNQPPVAQLSANTLNGNSPLTVSFKGDGSSDPNGDALTYAWNFGDGTTSTQPNPTKVFTGTGVQAITVTLTVSDGKGLSDTKTVVVSLNNTAPTAKITSPGANTLYPLDRESQYTLSASVTDEETSSLTYAWQVTLRHNTHEHREPINTSVSPTITVSPVGCDGETYYYFVKLTVTDKGGLTAVDSVKIYPDCNSGKLAISNLSATAQGSRVQLSWTAPSVTYDNVLVVAKVGSGFSDRPSSQVYPADANFMGTGADFFGGKVLYQGVASNLAVTNLTAGQTYYFRVYTRRGSTWTGGVETSATIAPFPVKESSCYRIVSRASGKVLTIDGTDNGSAAIQRTDANTTAQQWKFRPTSDGYYQIISQKTNKVLDQVGIQQADRAPIGVWDYAGGDNQQWKPMQTADGYTQFLARHSGKAIDLLDGNQNEGAATAQVTANTGTTQQWLVEEKTCVVSTPPAFSVNAASCYRLVARPSGKVLTGEGAANGSAILQRTDANLASQQWKFIATSDGYYQIVSQRYGKVVDVKDALQTDQTPVHLWDYLGTNNQQWKPVQNADGYTQFIVRHSGKALDLMNYSQDEGAVVTQYTPSNATAQQWKVEERACIVSTPPAFSANSASCYRLVSRSSGKVLTSDGTDNGSAVTQRTDANTAAQQWKFATTSDGYYQIISQQTNKVLDQVGNLQTDRGPLGVWAYAGGNNQQWKPVQTADGYTQFVARHSGKAVDVLDGSQNEGAAAVQFTANTGATQQWRVDERTCVAPTPPVLVVKANSCYRLVSRVSSKVLTSDGTDNGSAVTQRTDANTAAQQWKFMATSDGYYQIVSQKTNKVLDQVGNLQTDRAPLGIWDYAGGNNQQWKPVQNTDGYTQFIARHSGKAIDLLDFNQNEGATVGQFQANATTAQQWLVEEKACVVSTPPTLVVKSNSCYRLIARPSGKVLTGEGAANGSAIVQRTDANLASQQWKFVATSDGYYQIVSQQYGKVVDVKDILQADRTPVHLWDNLGAANQQWKPVQNADGYTQFIVRHSGKALDLLDFNQNEGATVSQFQANATTAQQWKVEEKTCVFAPTACYKISSRNGGRVIAVQSASKNDGAQIRQQTYAGKASQQWKMQLNADGYYQITNGNSGKLIDVSGISTNDGASLIQWASTGGQNQQWKIALNAQGYYTLLARHSGKMMNQKGNSADENIEIVQWPATGAQNQQWLIDAVGCSIPGSRMGAVDFAAVLPEQLDSQYALYPNPAQMLVNVDLQAAQGQPASVTLTDIRGKAVYRRLVDTAVEPKHTITTSEYAAGVYLVSIEAADQPKATLRLVIER